MQEESSLTNTYTTYVLVILAIYITLRIICRRQRERLQLYFNKQSKLMKDFVSSTRIRELHFTPHMLALNPHLHTVSYMFVELYTKYFYGLKFEREMFRLSDGGTIAIDWLIDHEGGFPRKHS